MAKLKRYLIVSELKHFGYLVGSYSSLKEAKKNVNLLISKYEQFHAGYLPKLYEEQINCRKYKIHPSVVENYNVIQNAIQNTTNGVYSVVIMSTNIEGFSIKQLILDRGQMVFAFNLNEVTEREKFTQGFPNFIAN
jgi:hypothetical protein